jgi:hypothetical protein
MRKQGIPAKTDLFRENTAIQTARQIFCRAVF